MRGCAVCQRWREGQSDGALCEKRVGVDGAGAVNTEREHTVGTEAGRAECVVVDGSLAATVSAEQFYAPMLQ